MSRWHARVPASAIQSCRGHPTRLAVLTVVCKYARSDGLVQIGGRQVAAEVGCHYETAWLHLAALVSTGHLHVIHRGCGKRATIYRLAWLAIGSSDHNQGSSDRMRPSVAIGSSDLSQRVTGARGALPPECAHGDPYGGRRCIDCRQERSA